MDVVYDGYMKRQLVVLVLILGLLILGMGGWLVYQKYVVVRQNSNMIGDAGMVSLKQIGLLHNV